MGAIAAKGMGAKVFAFSSKVRPVRASPGIGVLDLSTLIGSQVASKATFTGRALSAVLQFPFDRVFVLTDGQSSDDPYGVFRSMAKNNSTLYEINLVGYPTVNFPVEDSRIVQLSGFSDRVFDMVKAYERPNAVEAVASYA